MERSTTSLLRRFLLVTGLGFMTADPKSPLLLFLTLLALPAALSGCHAPNQGLQFSEVPDYMMSRPAPRERIAELDLQVLGAQPGLERLALVEGIRKAIGPPGADYPEPDVLRTAQSLADRALARDKVTLRVPRDLAGGVARKLEAAGLIVKVAE